MTVLDWARRYVRHGLSVIPVNANGKKTPALATWKDMQERMPTEDDLAEWFAPHRAVGVAVVCGKVSGNLAVIDFESQSAWDRWMGRAVEAGRAPVFDACPLVRTPKGGRHLYCRIEEGWAAGTVLARDADKRVLVEVRGQGHYVLAPGCPPACHPLNIPYEFEREGWLK